MKTIVSLLILLTLFSISTFAANSPPRQKAILKAGTYPNSIAFSPDGKTLASSNSGTSTHAFASLRLWDVLSGQSKANLAEDRSGIVSVAFSPDGSTLATAGPWQHGLRLWDVASGKQKTVLAGKHGLDVFSVAFSPDGSTLASGCRDNTVRLWDTISEEQISVFTGHAGDVLSVAFSPDSSTLASASKDKTVRLWDVVSGQQKAVLPGHTNEVESVAFSPDGSTLASASHSNIHLWDLTASTTTSAIVRISPASILSPSVGEQFAISLNIVGGENVAGYQATVVFDSTALHYFSSEIGDYLSDSFLVSPVVGEGYVTVVSTGLIGSNGDGVLGTITFQVTDVKTSALSLSQVTFVDPDGKRSFPHTENGMVIYLTEGPDAVHITEDVNSDGIVNIQDMVVVTSNFGEIGENKADVNGDGVVDIVDLVKVAGVLRDAAAAPSFHPQTLAMLTAADVQGWLMQAQHLNLTDIASQKGVRFLEQLLAVLTPQETILLPNYPNPFNPETWIPYQLANSSDVQIVIYDTRGITIRSLALGYQPEGYYTTHSRAAYWDGRNNLGERVATGVYFYQLQTGDMSPLRKMVILK